MPSSMQSFICLLLPSIAYIQCSNQIGPEPWHYSGYVVPETEVPPDLKFPTIEKKHRVEGNNNPGDWFFKRILAIVLKGGQVKTNEGVDVDVSLRMRFTHEHWNILNEYITSQNGLNEDMYRRSVGYIEDAIYKPSIVDKIAMAWSDYVQLYLSMYKMEIVYGLIVVAILLTIFILWSRMSHKHIMILLFMTIYFYEVVISYKEAEQQDYQKFVTVLNKCKLYFWLSSCDVPGPDILLFLKHLHPLKILARIFTTIISEPMIILSTTVSTIVKDLTGGLWFPFDTIISGFLILIFNVLIIMSLIMILFNFILNMPFNLSFFAGLINIGVTQRNRTIIDESTSTNSNDNVDRLSGSNLDRLLTIMSTNLTNSNRKKRVKNKNNLPRLPCIIKSASTGHLSETSSVCTVMNKSPAISAYKPGFDVNKKTRRGLFKIGGGDT